jgi:hypothetical protein
MQGVTGAGVPPQQPGAAPAGAAAPAPGAPAADGKKPEEKKFAGTRFAKQGSGGGQTLAHVSRLGCAVGLHSFVIYDKKFTVDAKYLPKKPLGKGAYGVVW